MPETKPDVSNRERIYVGERVFVPPVDELLDRDAALLAADTRGRLALQLSGLAAQLDRIETRLARLDPLLDLFDQAEGLTLPQVFKLLTQRG